MRIFYPRRYFNMKFSFMKNSNCELSPNYGTINGTKVLQGFVAGVFTQIITRFPFVYIL